MPVGLFSEFHWKWAVSKFMNCVCGLLQGWRTFIQNHQSWRSLSLRPVAASSWLRWWREEKFRWWYCTTRRRRMMSTSTTSVWRLSRTALWATLFRWKFDLRSHVTPTINFCCPFCDWAMARSNWFVCVCDRAMAPSNWFVCVCDRAMALSNWYVCVCDRAMAPSNWFVCLYICRLTAPTWMSPSQTCAQMELFSAMSPAVVLPNWKPCLRGLSHFSHLRWMWDLMQQLIFHHFVHLVSLILPPFDSPALLLV